MLFESYLDAGLVILLAVALAEYFKWRTKSRGFQWLALAGIFLIFAGTFSSTPILQDYIGIGIWSGLQAVFALVGWVFALVGTIIIAYETLMER